MSSADNPTTDVETLEHLLDVIAENREQQCNKIRETASRQAAEIVRQARSSARERMHRHVLKLREKYSHRISAVTARNRTLLRQQQQITDRELLDTAWPLLTETLYTLWQNPEIREQWYSAVIEMASTIIIDQGWRIEHPQEFSKHDQQKLKQLQTTYPDMHVELLACDDIMAGIRIIAQGTVVDATVQGLLRQRSKIEGMLIAGIKREASDHG